MEINWESQLAQLLDRLASSQAGLLGLLSKKHQLLMQRDHAGLAALASEEQQLCSELKACHEERQQLLAQAAEAGLPADSIRSLSAALPQQQAQSVQSQLDASQQRSHLLKHQSISQWVVVQRTLLHLSQMLEIIATGGHAKPTYGKGDSAGQSGSLMDQAV